MKKYSWLLSMWLVLTACHSTDGSFLAEIGEERLSVNDVLLQMPMELHGADSAHFVADYVDRWVNEHLLYQQGLKHVPNLDELERQAEQYRRDLIAQTYCNERMLVMDHQLSEEACLKFYEENKNELRLDMPIIQGICIQLLSNSSKVSQLKEWLEQIQLGILDHAEDLEQYCQVRAVSFDNYLDRWVPMSQLTDRLPVTVVDPSQFLQTKVYEMKDDDYVYLLLITDFRLQNDIQPYEYAKNDVLDLLIQRERGEHRKQLQEELKAEALKSGLLKLKN